MGLFSSTRHDAVAEPVSETQQVGQVQEHEHEEEIHEPLVTSPLDLKLKEKQRQLDGLKSRVNSLSHALEQMGQLLSESNKSVGMLSNFVEQSKLDAEGEKRLKSENAKLSTDAIEKAHTIRRLTGQLEKRDTEIEVLKNRAAENRVTLEKARTNIIQFRDKQNELSEALEIKNIELLNVNAKFSELTEQYDDLHRRHEVIEDHNTALQTELDRQAKRESEQQQTLGEVTALHEEEVRRNKSIASELEASKRALSELNSSLIEARSERESLFEELEFSKNASEDERRKYDNRVFGLKTEIDNLTSERRVIRQSLAELQEENSSLKKGHREVMIQNRELENQLRSMQRIQEKDRKLLAESNAKVSDLNLRYNSALTDSSHEQRQREKLELTVEALSEENARLREYRSKYDAVLMQVTDLKGLVADYQELVGKERISAMRETPPTYSSPYPEDDKPEDDGNYVQPGSGNVVNIKQP